MIYNWLFKKRDTECGKHSGFPDCCVYFFINIWQPAFQINSFYYQLYRDLLWKHLKFVGYVVCPSFVRNQSIIEVVKGCNCYSKDTRPDYKTYFLKF